MAGNPITDFFSDTAVVFRQTLPNHGVYNRLGHKVGSAASLDDVCKGKWFLLKGEVAPPNNQLYVQDLFGRLTLAQTHCLDKGRATTIATPAQVKKAADKVANEDNGFFGLIAPPVNLDPLDFGFDTSGDTPKAGGGLVLAGLAALGLVLLVARR